MSKKITADGEIVDEACEDCIVSRAPPFFKTPFNHDTDAETKKGALLCTDPSRTQQQFAKDADINVILAKFTHNGELRIGDIPMTAAPLYQDIETTFDLQESIVTRAEVDAAWNALPAKVRNVLRNPETFVAYLDQVTPEHLDELTELGLVQKPEPPKQPDVQGATSPAPPAPPPAVKPPESGAT